MNTLRILALREKEYSSACYATNSYHRKPCINSLELYSMILGSNAKIAIVLCLMKDLKDIKDEVNARKGSQV